MGQRAAVFGRFLAVFGLVVAYVLSGACLLGCSLAGPWGAMLLPLLAIPGASANGLVAAVFSLTRCRHWSHGLWAISGAVAGGLSGTIAALSLGAPSHRAVLACGVFGTVTCLAAALHVRHMLPKLPTD
jgi:hypothetical protein